MNWNESFAIGEWNKGIHIMKIAIDNVFSRLCAVRGGEVSGHLGVVRRDLKILILSYWELELRKEFYKNFWKIQNGGKNILIFLKFGVTKVSVVY